MSQPPRSAIVARVLLIALIIGAALLIKPALVIPTVKSPTALLVISLMVASYLALSGFVLPKIIKRTWLRESILWAILATGAALLILPYFRTVRVEQPAPRNMKRLASSPLHGINHRASGEAVLYQLESGGWAIRLEGIDIQGGPDYNLYLLQGSEQETKRGGTDLGDLAGNQGDLHFLIPDSLPKGPLTALIWCEFFSVPVANATLSIPQE